MMNLSGKFYVKSNYIRAAKDNWVLCEVRLLTDDVDTFLCIKSLTGSGDTDDRHADESAHDNRIRSQSEKRGKSTNFTALCNLSEYKSCSVRTVTVNERDSFAIRLVPSGVIGNKQLLIASVDENEITTWLAICKSSIGKKGKQQQNKDNISNAGTLSKAGSFLSLKPMTSPFDADFDEGLLDNEVYEAYSSEDKIPALLEEAGDWIKLRLNQPECYLRLTEERLEVLDAVTQKPVQWFPYLLIRRFGAANGVLRVDAGRRCSTGDGRFFFRCSPPNGQPVDMLVTQIRQLALEAKQRLKRTQLASSNLELSDRTQSRNTLIHTPDATTEPVVPETNGEFQSGGTLPRARSKRAKPALHPPVDRSGRVNGFDELKAPKATPEAFDDPDAPRSDGGQDGCDVVRAVRVKATNSPAESPTSSSNFYDNLPRPPPKGARLPGAVNVLPLPIRAKAKDSNGLARDHSHEPRPTRSPRPKETISPSTENGTAPTVTRQASAPRTQSSTNQKLGSNSLASKYAATPHIDNDAPPPGPAPLPPGVTIDAGKTSVSGTNGSQQEENATKAQPATPSTRPKQLGSIEPVRSSMWKTSSPTTLTTNRLSQSEGNSSSSVKNIGKSPSCSAIANSTVTVSQNGPITGAQTNTFSPSAVMRVPPFTAPKPTTGSSPHSISTPASPSESSRVNHTDPYPVPLSRVLNPKISSTSVYLRGPHPSTIKKESVHCAQVNINPTSSVSSMINRINAADRHSSQLMPKSEPVKHSPSSSQPTVNSGATSAAALDDPKNYLSELDSVIKELCEANEAAVQATREAARRRHQVGWPGSRNETALTTNGRQTANT